MAKKKQKKKKKMPEQAPRPKDFLDMIAPAAVKFNTDHFILGSRYHTAMTLKSYPPMTDELALLRGLGDMGGVNLRLTARQVTPAEEDAILHAATNKSRMERSNTNDYKQSVTAEANLRDMAELLAKQRQEKEPLIHCGVYLDIAATDTEKHTITTSGRIVIGVDGRLDGTVQCLSIDVEGALNGTVNASEVLSVKKTGRVSGQVTTGKLSVELGAVFDVESCRMRKEGE